MTKLPDSLQSWFDARGWQIHPHQRAMLERAANPALLLIAPTGGGKTLAGFLPTLSELAEAPRDGLHTLYISPLKALAADIRRTLLIPIEEAGLADSGRGPHRRHARQPQETPARRPAAYPSDHA